MCVFHSVCIGVCVKGNNRGPLLMCSLLCVSFTECVSKRTTEISHWCAVCYVQLSQCVCQGNNRDLSLMCSLLCVSFTVCVSKGTTEISSLMCSLLCTSFVHRYGSVPNIVILYVVPVDVKPHNHPQSANAGFQLSHSPWFKFFRQLIKEGHDRIWKTPCHPLHYCHSCHNVSTPVHVLCQSNIFQQIINQHTNNKAQEIPFRY